ncbi:MAG: PAS domain-containing protein [Desulfobacterales bacterium]|nr:PAS domain-containing protein [Desulfobacterales bacterium]
MELHTWESAFNAIDDWISIIDTNFIIQKSNTKIKTFCSKSAGDAIGNHCHMLLHKTGHPVPNCPLSRMMISGKRETQSFGLDTNQHIQVTVTPIRDKRAQLLGAIHVVRQIPMAQQMVIREKIEIKDQRQVIPICSTCKKVRDKKGRWQCIESYLEHRACVSFSHGICPECMDRVYGHSPWYRLMKKSKDGEDTGKH